MFGNRIADDLLGLELDCWVNGQVKIIPIARRHKIARSHIDDTPCRVCLSTQGTLYASEFGFKFPFNAVLAHALVALETKKSQHLAGEVFFRIQPGVLGLKIYAGKVERLDLLGFRVA